MRLPPALVPIFYDLLVLSEKSRIVTLDALGDAIGTRAVSTEDIDELIAALERRGRRVQSPRGGGSGERNLKLVLDAARALQAELERKPTLAEIATRSGLAEADVKHALALARVMQR